MTNTLKEFHFTDEQIEMIYNLVFNHAINHSNDDYDYKELTNQIADQIVNHSTNS